MRELRPLPSTFLFGLMLDDFPREVEVTFSPFTPDVVKHDRFPEAGRFSQADVSWDDCFEDLLLEMGLDFFDHLTRKVGPLVIHGQKYSLNLECRIE